MEKQPWISHDCLREIKGIAQEVCMAKTFKYYSAHIWIIMSNYINNITIIDNFKLLLKALEGHKC